MTPTLPNITDRPHYVYRHYNTDGQVIYIGRTHNPKQRFRIQRSKDWWREVASSQVIGPMSYAEAIHAETWAIRADQPIHNKHIPRQRTLQGTELSIAIRRRLDRADVEALRDELAEARSA